MVSTAGVSKIVSDPLHAERARSYAGQLRPDLAARLSLADDYRPLERWVNQGRLCRLRLARSYSQGHPVASAQVMGEPAGEPNQASRPRTSMDALGPVTPSDQHL
jgi:hypothetical protein